MTDHAAVVEHARRLLDEGATLLLQPRVGPNGVPRYSVDHRIASHSSVEIRVPGRVTARARM